MIGTRASCWALLAAAWALAGCATPGGLLGSKPAPPKPDERVIRPEAAPEYDVLVAQQLTHEGRSAEAVEAYLRAVAKDDQSAWLHRRTAVALAQHNRLDEALVHGKRAVELDPEDWASRLFLAQLYRLQREGDEARAVLTTEEGEPGSPEAAFLLYQIHLEAGRSEQALEAARWLIEAEPESLRGHVAVANVHQRMGRAAEAESSLRKALEQDPGNLRLYGALARLLRQREAYDEEIALYQEILEIYPHHHATLVALGEVRLAREDVDGAIEVFMEVEERYPEDADSVARLAYLLFEARRLEEAQARFEQILAERSDEYQVAFFLGVVKRRNGQIDEALRLFRSIPPDDRYFSDSRTQIASVLERRGLYVEALAEVERANQVRPNRDLELYAATLQAKSGALDDAVARVEAMLLEEPESDELLFNLGVVYGEAQQTDEAITYMQKALDRNPDNASALNYIGYTWAEEGIRLDEAERMITRAIELRPDDGYIVDSLGWVYYMRALPLVESGRPQEARPYIRRALEELERAHELTGGDPVISEHLGDTYLLLDQKERALEKFEEAIRLEPREGEQPELFEKFENLQRELR
ncbi:MAG: tetratricopeptide repeat protein [Myxococcota bacterium]|nr:tetratricopeptide repeat protein [Myxococcota bacterium]